MIARFLPLLFLFCPLTVFAQPVGDKVCLIRSSPTEQFSDSCGTGFFVGDNTIITAYHVVRDFAEDGRPIRIEYKNKIYFDVFVLLKREHQDIAVVAANIDGESWFEVEKGVVEIGDKVKAFGFAKGKWENHSAKGKIVSRKTVTIDVVKNDKESVQTAASVWVEPGMSGGPLVNEKGKVVGVLQSKSITMIESYYSDLSHIQEVIGELNVADNR